MESQAKIPPKAKQYNYYNYSKKRGVEGGSPPSEKALALSFCKSNSSMIFACDYVPITT